jgi:hypothetical protein
MKKKIAAIFNELKSLIIFYNTGNGQKLNIKKINENTTEEELFTELENLIPELNEIDVRENKNFIYKKDDCGYNIIHYVCALSN